MPLPVRVGAGAHERRAVGPELDAAVLGAGDARGAVDEGGEPDPELDGICGGTAALLLGPQVGVAGQLQREVEPPAVVAAVVDQICRRRVRELAGADQVAAAELGGVDGDLSGEEVDGPLEQCGGLGPAGAAVGGGRRRRGDHARQLPVHAADPVRAGGEHAGVPAEHGAHLRVRPCIDEDADGERLERPVPAPAEGHVLDLRAPVAEPDHVLRAVGRPAHRPADPPGEPREEDVLGVRPRLRPEAATDVGGDHPDLVDREVVEPAQQVADGVRSLAAEPVREAPVRLPPRGRRPGLDRRRGEARAAERCPDHHLAPVGCGVAAASGGVQRHVRAGGGEQQHLAVSGGLHGGDRGERSPVDDDELGRVGADGRRLAHDGDDGLPHEAHHAVGQQGPSHGLGERRVHRWQRPDVEVGCDDDVEHPGERPCRVDVDAVDARMGDRRHHVGDDRCAGEVEVGDVGGPTGQEPWVLGAADRLAEERHGPET